MCLKNINIVNRMRSFCKSLLCNNSKGLRRLHKSSLILIRCLCVLSPVQNTGGREGCEVVQLYINDVISSVTTPVKQLRGFEKVTLRPGEKKTVDFTLTPRHLSFIDANMKRIVEAGTFEVMIGASSEYISLKGTFEVIN